MAGSVYIFVTLNLITLKFNEFQMYSELMVIKYVSIKVYCVPSHARH